MKPDIVYFLEGKTRHQLDSWVGYLATAYVSNHPGHMDVSKQDIKRAQSHSLNKSGEIKFLRNFYLSPFFQALAFQTMPKPFQQLFYYLVWFEPVLSNKDVFNLFHIKAPENYYHMSYNEFGANPHFLFFFLGSWENYGGWGYNEMCKVFLPEEVRKVARTWMKQPDDFELKAYEGSSFDRTYSGVLPDIFYQICALSSQGILKRLNSGRLSAATLKSIQKEFGINEPFQNMPPIRKSQNLLATEWIGFMAESVTQKDLNDAKANPAHLMLSWWKTFFKNRMFKGVPLLLPHVQNIQATMDYSGLHTKIREFLMCLEEGTWHDIKHVKSYIQIHDLDWALAPRDAVEWRYTLKKDYTDTHYPRPISTVIEARNLVFSPIMFRTFLWLAVCGILEVGLTNTDILGSAQDPSYIPGQELEGFRLTALGAYILGKRDHYDCKKQFSGQIILDTDRLMLTLDGDDPALRFAIERIAMKISENRFKIDRAQFKPPLSAEQSAMMQQFQDLLPPESEYPPIWSDFFHQSPKIEHEGFFDFEWAVIKFPENPTLFKDLAANPALKGHILLAEDYHLLVRQSSYGIVYKQLKAQGVSIPLKKTF